MDEIVNRVSQSALITFDLEEHYPQGMRMHIDIKEWLFQHMVLREKEFRRHLKEHDWSQYQDAFVSVSCSVEAIVPQWAFVLVASHLQPFAKRVVFGTAETLETQLYQEVLDGLDYVYLKDKPVILKGCSNRPVPLNAYIMAMDKIQPIARSVMYGEACSAVPLYKRK